MIFRNQVFQIVLSAIDVIERSELCLLKVRYLRLRGDDIFGHRITVTYFRDQTAEEAEFDKRYVEALREAKERELQRLQEELGVVCYAAPGKRGKLRIVA